MGLAVHTTRLATGERLPLLVDTSTGVPLFAPTVFAVTQLRARHRAAGTITQALHSVRVFLMALERLGVDLEARLSAGRLLTLHEIDAVLGALSHRMVSNASLDPSGRASVEHTNGNVVSIGARRGGAASAHRALAHQTIAIRAYYIKQYVQWLGQMYVLNLPDADPRLDSFVPSFNLAVEALEGRRPVGTHRSALGQRQGLEQEALNLLCQAVDLDSPMNPWRSEAVRVRNQLIVLWLLTLGIRRGELLSVQLVDINAQRSEVLIARRPDDPMDPRKHQPNAKTRDRLLQVSEALMSLTMKYIRTIRKSIPGAEKHPYLFVSTRTGAPLELASVNRVFSELKSAVSDLPRSLCAHQLRHTWNDQFSEEMDRRHIGEQLEHRMRATLMGWSSNSTMPAVYTRRHTQRKAAAASLDLQRRFNIGVSDEEAKDDRPDRA